MEKVHYWLHQQTMNPVLQNQTCHALFQDFSELDNIIGCIFNIERETLVGQS